jgi:glutathione synthase/RimK-type ligase-like ATP-grasp enzyme
MRRIAFATSREFPQLCDDDLLAVNSLREAGVAVSPGIWDDLAVDWSGFEMVVIRSTWDYYLRPDEFAAWVRRLAAPGPRLWNPPAAVIDNIHKGYLARLADAGVAAVATEQVAAGATCDLHSILVRRGWDDAVVKPAISAGAVGTWRASRADPDEPRFAEQLRTADVLVQPYLPEVELEGEWSLVFFERQFSHAVLKRPAAGDFRVQEHLGGASEPAEPPGRLVDDAVAALAVVPHPLLYARVDGVARDGCLLLTELEITEPYLYLGLAPASAARFAAAILRALA